MEEDEVGYVIVKVTMDRYITLPKRDGISEDQMKAEACWYINGAYEMECKMGQLAITDIEVMDERLYADDGEEVEE